MPTNGVYLYSRTYGDDNVVVILNGVDKENKVDMSRYEEIIPVGKSYRDVLSGKIIVPVNENREFTFAPREVLILQSE
jgi:hypothetical protein